MESHDFAVLIGRFQPFHLGHQSLFEHATNIAGKVIFLIGSHNAPIGIRNPWNTAERELFIRAALSGVASDRYTIAAVADSAYNFNDWVIRVQQKITAIAGNGRVAIVGHYKDDTSYYLNHFPQWDLETMQTQAGGISSTDIRNACFEGRLDGVRSSVCREVFELLTAWTASEGFARLQEDYRFVQNYRKKWESAPFPPTFITADAVVTALGHVLLVKRKLNPGKGRLALPGGFVKPLETIEKACLRELREETNLEIGFKELHGSIRMNHVFDHPYRDPRGRVIAHAFMFELNVKELPKVRGGDDAAEAFWFPLHRLEESESQFFNDHAQLIKFFVNRMN